MEILKNGYNVTLKALCWHEGEFLALRRSRTHPTNAFDWDLPGGILDIGEEVNEGIRREIREETGLEVDDLRVFDVVSRTNEQGEHWVTLFYTCTAKGNALTLSYEHDQFQWLLPEKFVELPGSERNKEVIRQLLANRSTKHEA